MSRLLTFPRLLSLSLGALLALSGCVVNGKTFDPLKLTQESKDEEDRQKQETQRAEEQAKADALRAEQQKKQAENRAQQKAEADRKAAEDKEKAATTVALQLSDLGLELDVPGDVVATPHQTDRFGSPAYVLRGPASGFTVILANAQEDRYALHERISREMSEFKFGFTVTRRSELPKNGFEYEYSYRTYFPDGSVAATLLGYFSKVSVNGKPFHCLNSDLSEKELTQVIKACKALQTSGKVLSRK